MPDLDERLTQCEEAVAKALYENVIGGYEVMETPAGITLIGPGGRGHSRDIFIVQVVSARLQVGS